MITKEEALSLIKTEYRRLDQITHVNTESIIIKISTRLTRKFGYFEVKNKNAFSGPSLSIMISDQILSDEEIFCDVIKHEYAHAVVYLRYPKQNHGHDIIWKNVCTEVGCIPKATRKALNYTPRKSKLDKYILKCRCCGAESRYKTEGKVIQIVMHKKRGTVICRRCKSNDFELIRL